MPARLPVSNSTEPVYVIDGVVQAGLPRHLHAADITDVHLVKGRGPPPRYGNTSVNGVVVITTRHAPTKALNQGGAR